MKIRVFGDIHGKDFWQYWVGEKGIDKYIFLGDYTDAFDLLDVQILKTLKELVKFKKNMLHRAVFLYGNHDLQYLDHAFRCSGYRPSYTHQVQKLLAELEPQIAYQYTPAKKNPVLFTHAGLSKQWYDRSLKTVKKFKKENYADVLNKIFKKFPRSFADVSFYRGGLEDKGSPVWADQREFLDNNGLLNKKVIIPGLDQVVGHQPQKTIHSQTRQGVTMTWIDTQSYPKNEGNQEYFDMEFE